MIFHLLRRLAGTFAIALLLAVSPAHAAKKMALVIGNAAYAEAPLKNPVSDARAVAATLKRQGFEVILKENATKAQLNEVVADFGEKLGEGDTALFFFAGHGMQVQGRNYLIPTDAKINSEQRVRLETLDVEAVLDQMAAARARVSMVILDACRNNPFERRFRSVGGGLAQINAPEGTMIAYATSPGRVAADGDGANGLYTQELLKALAQPGLKVEDVFKQVRVGVARASNGAQVPWEASSLTGDFYFQPTAASSPASSADPEVAYWDSVKDSNNPVELHAYLSAYPAGTFAPLARTRVAALEGAGGTRTDGAMRSAGADAPQVAAATVARAEKQFDGTYYGLLPAGPVFPRQFQISFTVENGAIRMNGTTSAALSQQAVVCYGTGIVYADGVFDDAEIRCSGGGLDIVRSARGTVNPGKEILATFASPSGQSQEVRFR